jgi:predicted phage terminase large subunit-like protein
MALAIPSLADVQAELARRDLLRFTQYTFEDYETNWHHVALCQALERVLAGEIDRLMVFMPPQNGKSEIVSRRLPAYALGRYPDLRIAAASYGASLAQDMSRDVQRIIAAPDYRRLFPGTRLAESRDDEARQVGLFQVVGRRGTYRAVGVGQGLTGKTMDLGIIDDPIKDRREAESETTRKHVWDWYRSTFLTRQFGRARIVLTMTRWHEDDLAGRLLRMAAEDSRADRWYVVKFPAIAVEGTPDDPRKPGEPLWPAKYPISQLAAFRAGAEYEFSALYQQNPTPPEGGLFKRADFAVIDARPAQGIWVRFWDCAATEGDGDYTVGTLVGKLSNGTFCIADVIRGQWNATKVDAVMRQTAQIDGRHVRIREEQEPGSSGKAVIANRAKALAGFDYRGIPATGDKETRWRPLASQAGAGNVTIVRGPWNGAWLDELCSVPHGLHDDQADSAAGGFNCLTVPRDAVVGTTRWGLD